VYEIETRRLLGTERKRSWVGPRRCWCMRRESGAGSKRKLWRNASIEGCVDDQPIAHGVCGDA